MMILQGIDLLKIERIKRIYLKYSGRFLNKILTDREIKQIQSQSQSHEKIYNKIASKFSTKEAASKALGTGFASGIKIKDFEVLSLESGKPTINLHGKAKKKIKKIKSSSVSISDEDGFVISIVTFLVENQ